MRGRKLTTQTYPVETVTVAEESRIRLAVKRVQALRKRNYTEELAIKSDSGLDRLSRNRRRLVPAIIVGAIATVLAWLVALSFPHSVSDILWTGFSPESRLISILTMSIPFTPPFITVFALGTLLFPAASQPESAADFMSTFNYRQSANRRWSVIIVATIVGVLNCMSLAIVLADATGQ